jgi:predicted PhzF superfamily epimerase YddE/YHI9
LQAWLPDATLQAIAAENNLSETAYFVPEADGFRLRWFTPAVEVDLCGHATLASAFVLYEHLGYAQPEIRFHTRSGVLTAAKAANGFSMVFPASMPVACATPPALTAALGRAPRQTLAASNYVAVYDNEEEIRALTPDFGKFHALDRHGVVVTAPGREVDFVSRFFAPKFGVNEDPVTG